ncbi:MAG: NTP transferase domain-containing protein [Kordiimonadaceae bacterium]|nr:NTP transferase domain-containing protein [Kordiimonadaceae bacterium]
MGEKIVAIVGARLNSSRLPGKHLLPLAGTPLIERLWQRLSKIEALSEIVLATTDDAYNAPLRDWAEKTGRTTFSFGGGIDDVVGRVDAAVGHFNADILVYVCGDCPLVEPETIARMLAEMVDKPEIESVLLENGRAGQKNIHEGFDIYRRSFWNQMVTAAQEPFEREHVGAVYHRLGKVTPKGIAYVKEPVAFSRLEHRISVDTPSDYRFMNKVYADWYADNAPDSIVDLKHVIARLCAEPALRNINRHVYQKGLNDTPLKAVIITESGADVGLGHLMRMLAVTAAMQDFMGAKMTVVIKGQQIEEPELSLVPHIWVDDFSSAAVATVLKDNPLHIVDLKDPGSFLTERQKLEVSNSVLIGVDLPEIHLPVADMAWVPSFYLSEKAAAHANIHYGWDCFLLRDAPLWQRGQGGTSKKLLVLTGGSDVTGLGEHLPAHLSRILPDDISIDWVQGPYAAAPNVPDAEEGRDFTLLEAPANLPHLFGKYDVVLCVFGVSFFECMRAGVPTIVFDPVGAASPTEWAILQKEFPNIVASGLDEAVGKLVEMVSQGVENASTENISEKLQQGPEHFARKVAALMENTAPIKKVG